MKFFLLFFASLLLLPFLFHFSFEEKERTPALSRFERAKLADYEKEKARQKIVKRKKREQKRWLLSSGSNWPCPNLLAAKKYAQKLGIAFALRCQGGIRGWRKRDLFPSASSSKALLLLAFLQTQKKSVIVKYRNTLIEMIRYSDNDAADQIYYLLGDQALARTAKSLGLRQVEFVGYWASILFSPADYVRLFASFPRSFPKKERVFAIKLLSSITPEQRWGIAKAFSGPIYFKGGWRPEREGYLVLQGALLRQKSKRMSLAIFSLGFSTQKKAEGAIEKTARLIFKG